MVNESLISEKYIQNFERDGYVVIPNVLPDEMIERIIIAGDKMIASDCQDNRQPVSDNTDGFRNSIEHDDVFIELLANKKILPYLIRLLGPSIKLLTSQLIYRSPIPSNLEKHNINTGWHRDFYQAQHSLGHANIPRLDIKVGYCLTDLPEANCGGTLLLPGSHLLKENLPTTRCENPSGTVDPILSKGDCLLFENRTWHAGGVNYSNVTRKIIMMGYTYTWIESYDCDFYKEETVLKAKELHGDIGLQLLNALPKPVQFDFYYKNKPLEKWARKNDFNVTNKE